MQKVANGGVICSEWRSDLLCFAMKIGRFFFLKQQIREFQGVQIVILELSDGIFQRKLVIISRLRRAHENSIKDNWDNRGQFSSFYTETNLNNMDNFFHKY